MKKCCLCFFQVDGDWTPWSVWSDCSVTCGQGTHVRTRACINPPPRNNGSHCSGPDRETQYCQTPPCLGVYESSSKSNCLLSAWYISQQIECTFNLSWVCILLKRFENLQKNVTFTYKTCSRLLVLHCFLLSTDDLCPWSPWSPCSQSCGAGSMLRHRVCVCEDRGEPACPPEAERVGEETQLCYRQPCPGTSTPSLS